MDIDLTTLSDVELSVLIARANSEQQARLAMTQAEQELERIAISARLERERIAREFVIARDREAAAAGQAPVWQQPTGAHDVYPSGYQVVHNGKTWTNTHPANSWEPGTTNSQWVQVIEDPEVGEPPLVEWGVGQEVFAGDLRSHNGNKWRAKIAHTTHEGWEPGPLTYAVWADLGPLEEATPPEEEPPPGEEPPTSTIPAWSPTATYNVGDEVTHNGKTWRCLVAHGAEQQGTWAPGVAHTVWQEVATP